MRAFLLLAVCVLGFGAGRADAGDFLQAWQRKDLRCEMTWTAAGSATLTVANDSEQPVMIEHPAGSVWVADEVRLIALQAISISVRGRAAESTVVPVVVLTSRSIASGKPFAPVRETEPQLSPLLAHFAKQKKVSEVAAQLAVLCVTENIGFAPWQQFLSGQRVARGAAAGASPPTDIVAAIDVLGILREIAPERTFALATDGELKLRALRNPWARARAVELYGMTAPGASPLPPELRTLLHTAQGDNCPTCRQRGSQPDNGF